MKKPHTRNETIEIEPPIGPDQLDPETNDRPRRAEPSTIETPTGEQAFRCFNARGSFSLSASAETPRAWRDCHAAEI